MISSLTLLAACSVPLPRAQWSEVAPTRADVVTIQVTNDRLSEVRVYLDGATARQRLGNLLAGQTDRFSVRAGLMTGPEVHLAIVPIDGSRGCASERIVAWPGQLVRFTIKDNGAFRFPDASR